MNQHKIYKTWAFLFTLPNIILFVLFFAIPAVLGLVFSFTNFNGFSGEFVGLDNYIHLLFHDEHFMGVIIRTTIFALIAPILGYLVSLGLALLLSDKDLVFGTVAKVLVYIPTLMSPVVSAITMRWLFGENFGFINHLLETIGLDPVKWSTDGYAAFIMVILVGIWGAGGFNMILILGRLRSIPPELYEAAKIDGASVWQRFRNVTIPMLKPITFLILLLGTISAFKEFAVIDTLTNGGPGMATTFYVLYMYRIGFERLLIGLASAGSMILFIILLVLASVQTKLQKGGEIS